MSDATVMFHVVWHLRNAVTVEVFVACAYDAAHMPDRNDYERRILEMRDPDCHIDPLLDEVHDAIEQQEIYGHSWMTREKFRQYGGNVTSPELYRRGHGQLSLQIAAARHQSVFRFLDRGKNNVAALEILRSFIREMDAPRRTF